MGMDALRSTHQETRRVNDEGLEITTEIQARDFALEALIREQTSAAVVAIGCATDEKHQAARLEHEHRLRRGSAVNALGNHFPRSTQYQLHYDKTSKPALAASGTLT